MGTNPNIILAGMKPARDPWETYDEVQQNALNRQLAQARLQGQGTENTKNALLLQETQRQMNAAATMRNAQAAAVVKPAPVTTNTGSLEVAPGVTMPGRDFSVQGPATVDRNAMLDHLAKNAPDQVMDAQQHFVQQDMANAKVQYELQKMHGEYTKQQLENAKSSYELVGQAAAPIAQAEASGKVPPEQLQAMYRDALVTLHGRGVDVSQMPMQYQPGAAANFVNSAMKAHEYVTSQLEGQKVAETNRHNVTEEQGQAVQRTETNRHNVADEQNTRRGQDLINGTAALNGANGQPSVIAQALANNTMKWSEVVSPRTPMPQKVALLQQIRQINPNYNSGDYAVEQGVAKQFTSGDVGKQLMAINTAREHVKSVLEPMAAALDNGDTQILNRIGNQLGVQFGSDKATNYRIAAAAVGSEAAKAFDGAGFTQSEREESKQRLSDMMSKGQFAGAIRTIDLLLEGKQKVAKHTYDLGRQGQPNFGAQGQSPAPTNNGRGVPAKTQPQPTSDPLGLFK